MSSGIESRLSRSRILSVTGLVSGLMLLAFDAHTLWAGAPAAGDLMLLVAGASASNTTGSVVEINTTTAGQTAVQTIALPGTGATAYRISGSATSTGYVALSGDRTLLAFTGANSTDTSSNVNTLNPRGVYTIDGSGTVAIQTTYTGGSGNQTRGATSLNNTAWFIADQGGFYSNSRTAASPSGNVRGIKAFGGTVYAFTASTTAPPVGTISAAVSGTYTGLPGLANGNSNLQDFYLIQSGSNGTTYDVLYVLSATGATAGTIAKYSLVSGSWAANGSYTTSFGGFGLAAAKSGAGAALYITTGTGATTANSVVKVTDTAGYNASISVTTASNVTLYTAATGTIVKGLDFAPQSGVAAVAPSITTNPQSQSIASGQTATLTVAATGTAPLSYQWYQGATGVTTTPVGTNSSSFTTPALTATASYWVRVSNGQGSADSTTATVTVTSAVAPSISQNPQSQTIASGQTATLTVTASGTTPLSYQWYQGTASVTTTPVGTNSSSFTTPALTATTSYWVRVSNGTGSADSITAVITVPSSTPPSGTGTAVLSTVPAGGQTQLTVTVTPGTNPASTNIAVTGDLSSIGGSTAQAFSGSGNTFSFAATVNAATTPGPKTLPITVSDGQLRSTTLNISLTVTAPLASSPIVISQIYGGGGNSGALYTNDFVQMYNRSNSTVDTSGWSLQYAPATGTGDWTGRQPLGGQIAPGQYYLISLASGGANGAPLPAANVIGAINISQTAGKLALVDNSDLLTGTAGCPVSTHVQDLVGYGTTADCWEGTGSAVVSSALTTTALFRLGSGLVDTNDNKADFFTSSPNPVSTAPIVSLPPQVFSTYPAANGVDIPLDATVEVTFTKAVTVDSGWFGITCATTGAHTSATEVPDGINRWITPNSNFAAGEQCTVSVFRAKVHDADTGTLSPAQDFVWSFTVASGAPAPETPDVHLLMGNPTGAVTDVSQPNNYLMSKPQYALSYNSSLGRPNWVSWHLTNAWIPVNHPARVDTFRPDPAVPPDWYRVQSFDFSGSGFDRGHMSPNADREDTVPDNQGTFLMSNMVAQSPDNNQGPWADFENYLRSVVRSSTPNEVYIVSGPVGTGGTGSSGAASTIAGGHVTVPASTWKVALVLADNGTNDDISRVTCSTTTVAVIMPNVQGIISDPWTKYLTTVNAVETLTGYRFFTNLPQPIQNCIKAGTNGVNPKNDQTISFTPLAPTATVGDTIPLQATASSGLAVTLTVTAGSGFATIVNGALHVTGAGMVTVQASQAGDVNYNAALAVSQSLQVSPGSQSITFGGSVPSLTYGAPSFQVSATGGPSGNPVTFSATGACTAVSQPGVATVTVVSAGTCNITASQAGNANYNAAPNAGETIVISRAAAGIHVSGGRFTYDGNPHGLSGTATGVFSEDLSSLLALGATFTNAPGGRASWAFTGNTNYLPANGSADVTITRAGAPTVTFVPGNLVVAVEGNGVAGAGSGPYTDNQASPLTLFQYAPNGTAGATYVSSLVFPQTGSGANLAVSGEYGSSSEGTLHLSGLGHYLTIAGYGINAAAYNANPALYGTDPAKPTALAQSGSLTGAGYTPVPRVVALVDPYGNVNSSTGLYNVFNTNNPRSVSTSDGISIYISGQGTGNDLTGGVFNTTLGSASATAITGATAASNNPPPATIAQDVRDLQMFGGQLYASIDSKEGTGSNRDYIGTLGAAGTPPTTLVGAPVRLPGFGNNGGTGKVTISAATTNGINSAGQEINLSPGNFFFANATTLYVADSGQPKNDSVTNDSSGVTLGNGGLQKWVLNSGTWSLQYTLGLQNGLPLVANSSAAGVTGLYGLAGKVVGGSALLYATTYSINDLDQTYLFGFTDVLAATTNPGTPFSQLAAAPADSNFKGVAFAPEAPAGSVTITSSPSGQAFTSAGTGCAPGSYTTPVTLIWTPGSVCTLSAASPQPGAPGTQYQFRQWEDGSVSPARTVTAPTAPAVYSAGFDTYYQLTTSAGVGGSVSAGGFILSGTAASITATPAAGYGFSNWTGNAANANNASTTITMNGPQSVTANFHALVRPTLTWATPADIVYGTALSAAQLNATASVAGSFRYTPQAGTVLNAGTGQTLSATFTPDDSNNYTSATATVSINVTRAVASVTPNAASKTYGTMDPNFAGTLTGFLSGDHVTATYSRTPGEAAGGYTIGATLNPAAVLGNYTITYNTAPFTINKAVLTVTANSVTRPYGTANPVLTPVYNGFVNGDTVAVLTGAPTLTTAATPASLPGSYPITAGPGSLGAANYSFTYGGGTLYVIPQVIVSPQSLNFTSRVGDTVGLPAQQISVFSLPAGASYSVTSSGGSWLSVPANSGATAPGSIPVSIVTSVTSSLSAGTYTGQVLVTPLNGSPVSVLVTLTVLPAAAPKLSVSPAVSSLTLTQGSTAASGQITVSNNGGGTLQFTAQASTDTGNWLSLPGGGPGSAIFGAPAVLNYTADSTGLSPGFYAGRITVKDAAGNHMTAAVSLTVGTTAPSILLSQNGLTFNTVAGGSGSPSQSFTVFNSGGGSMNWTAAPTTITGGNWLGVSPASGTSASGQAGSPVSVSVNSTGLAAGQYYGSVNVTADASNNSPETVSVLLNVMAASSGSNISASTGAAIFSGRAGSAPPQTRQITLFNPGATIVNFSAAALTSDGGSWLTGSPATGSLPPGSTPLTIQADLSGLTSGVHTGTIRVTFDDGTVAPITVLAIATGATPSTSSGGLKLQPRAAVACAGGQASYLVSAIAQPLDQATVQPAQPQLVRALLSDDCGAPVTSGAIQVIFAGSSGAGESPVGLRNVGNGVWEGTWTPSNPGQHVSLSLLASEGTLQAAVASLGVSVAGLSANAAALPSGVVNAASGFVAPPGIVSPGEIVSIYGAGLTSGTPFSASTTPLATTLNGTRVLLGGRALPLYYAGAGQINALIPQALNPNATYGLVVDRGSTQSVPVPVSLARYQPAIFTADSSGTGQGSVQVAGTALLAAPTGAGARPARRGSEYLSVYCTGLGPVVGPNGEPAPVDGATAPLTTVYQTTARVTAKLGGLDVPVVFSGLTPGLVALFQVNVQVPAGVQTGDAVPLVLTLSDPATGAVYLSNAVTVAIQ
jgi:DNA/RNA endonuclease G (NUC1)